MILDLTHVTRRLKPMAVVASFIALVACTTEAPQQRAATPQPAAPIILAPGEIDPNGPVQVALLVPTQSGDADRDALGRSLENAARMALSDTPGSQIQLTVYPTAGNGAQAASAATRAIADGADMIVGPLFSASVTQVGPIAQAAGVPVLSFSNNPSVAGQNVYVLGRTFSNTARRLLAYTAATGRPNTGVIYTQDAEGQAALAAVQSATRETSAQLVASSSYPRSRQGIPGAGQEFTNAMTSAGAQTVVMSDRGTGLVYAASFLPFYGMNTNSVQIVGLQNLEGSAIAAERALEGALFTVPDAIQTAEFETRYTSIYGATPHALAGLAYDGIAATTALIAQARQTGNRRAFAAENITSPGGFAGVEGAFRFRTDGDIDRALTIMKVTRDGPQLVDPAPNSFGFAGF